MAKLFFSYSHKDEPLRDELEIHLTALKRQGIISTWHDRRIEAGENFGEEISFHLEEADIILLLVSHYFIASDYCFEKEMKRALERDQEGSAIVIPVILSGCDWHEMPFGKLLACPKDGKPITKFSDMNEGFLEVIKSVKQAAKKISSADSSHTELIKKSVSSNLCSDPNIRTSNLRLKKEFTDHDRDSFLTEAFEYMVNFFENSLNELKKRNQGIETKFRRVDANRFSATIYVQGKEVSNCNIWLGDERTFSHGILYSTGSFRNNGFNESLSVENDGYTMFLKGLMGSYTYKPERNDRMTFEGASEYYWSMLIERLQ